MTSPALIDILPFSAATAAALTSLITDFRARITGVTASGDIAAAIAETRETFNPALACRLCLVVSLQPGDLDQTPAHLLDADLNAALEHLSKTGDEPFWTLKDISFCRSATPPAENSLAFLFPGQGSQYTGMGKDLTTAFPEAAELLEMAVSAAETACPITDVIYPAPDTEGDIEAALRQTDIAQPAIGAISLAMVRVLARFGIRPAATGGHSYGELPALAAAGWMDETTCMTLSATRGRLMAAAGKNGNAGTMLAVRASLDALDALIESEDLDVVLANRNSPQQGVLSGSIKAIEAAAAACKARKMRGFRIPVAAAFHSPLVAAAAEPFNDAVNAASLTPTAIPVVSNTTGDLYPASADAAKRLLGHQLLHPVNFVKNMETLAENGVTTLVEVGPKAVLTGLAQEILKDTGVQVMAMDASSGRKNGLSDLARVLSRLAALGYPVDLSAWDPQDPGGNRSASRSSGTPPGTMPQHAAAVTPSAPGQMTDEKQSTAARLHSLTSGDTMTPPDPAHVLRMVQESLKSIQKIQKQTAQAHETYLNAQTLACRAIQDMADAVRQLVPAAIPASDLPASRHTDPEASASPKPEEISVKRVPAPAVDETQAARSSERTFVSTDIIQAQTLEAVSTLTGYPVDMLELDMDMEADLGIDSIKRVEILSELEQQMQGMGHISPQTLGAATTLREMITLLNQQVESRPQADTLTVPCQPKQNSHEKTTPASTAPTDASDLTTALITAVSEFTGYPESMLEPQMDLEADLGIDAIKRTALLSALEAHHPGLIPASASGIARLNTLAEIAYFLSEHRGNRVAESPPVAATPALKIVPSPGAESEPQSPENAETQAPFFSLSMEQELDMDRFRVLGDHMVDGKARVPRALMAEWFNHVALHENPGLYLAGIRDMQVISEIELGTSAAIKLFHLSGEISRNKSGTYTMPLELRSNGRNGNTLHSRAVAVLTERPSQPVSVNGSGKIPLAPYHRTINAVYDEILSHGKQLQSLREITGYSDKGMHAIASTAPAPEAWISRPRRQQWITDPLIIDTAFQMGAIWYYEQTGVAAIPGSVAAIWHYADAFPDTVKLQMVVRELTDGKMLADIDCVAVDDSTILTKIEGLEMISEKALTRPTRQAG